MKNQPALLSINNYFYRRVGAEVVFLEKNRLFEEIGWQVVPFAMRHAKNLELPWQDYSVDEIEFGQAYSAGQKAARAVKITYTFEARKKITALALRVRPDVAYAHYVYYYISPVIFGQIKAMGISELIHPGETGVVFPSGDAESLAERLRQFAAMSDVDILPMRKVGRAWVERDFTAVRYRERLLELYRGLGVKA